MKLSQLRYFREIAGARSFTRAALKLGIAQPALSRQIRLLEEELGLPLLLRHPRGVEITEPGVVLLERGEFLLRSLDQLKAEVQSLASEPGGPIRFGCPPSLAKPLVVEPMTRFLERYPRVSFHLQEGLSDTLRSEVLADRLDFAIMSTPQPHTNLFIDPLFTEEIWLFASPGFCRPGRVIPIERVARLRVMVARRPHGVRSFVEQIMREAGLSLKVVIETDAWHAVPGLIRAGVGCFIAPRSAHEADVKRGHLTGGPIGTLTISRALVRRTDRPLRIVVMEFTKLLVAQIGRMGFRAVPVEPPGR